MDQWADKFSDALGLCIACGEPCTTGGCRNPHCSRCQRQYYPVAKHYQYVQQPDGTYRLEEVDDDQSVEG